MGEVPASEAEVLLRHAAHVRALARAVVFDPELAREVEQETWLAALEHAPRDLRDPRAWLATLVRHAARRLWSRAARRASRERTVAREHALASADAGSAELLVREQALQALVAAVRRLPEPQRTAIVLHYLDELPLREVARRTDAPLETVRSRVSRGLALLRAELRRGRGEAWGVALVHALALDPPSLRGVLVRLARQPIVLVTAMSSTAKLALASIALVLVLVAGWLARVRPQRDSGTLSASVASARAELAATGAAPLEPAPERVELGSIAAPRAPAAPSSTSGALLVHLVWADDDAPANDVPVRVDLAPTSANARRLWPRSSDAGLLALDALEPGTVVLQPLFGGFALASVAAGETAELRLAIPPGIRVDGLVRDVGGAPVADADVFLSGGATDAQYDGAIVARSDARGRFALRSAPAQVGACLSARAAGRAPTAQVVLTGAPRSSVELVLVFEREGRALAGRVLDERGAPVAGARVLIGSEREIVPLPRPDGTIAWNPIGELTTSAADGSFAVRGAPLGLVEVQTRAAGFAPWRGACDTRADERLEVHLEGGAQVSGTVRGRDGQPLAGARVRLAGGAWFARAETSADADGAYALDDLARGAVQLEVEEGAHGRASVALALVAGERATWDPVLGGGLELRGRVEAPGEALDGWTVRAWSDESRDYVEETKTDAEGRFALHACPEGELGLVLHGRGGTPFPVARVTGLRAGGPEIVLRPEPELAPTACIVGRLVDARGAPVRSADVRATNARHGSTLVHPDAQLGTFELARLPAGEWTLEVDGLTAGWGVERLSRALAPGETWDAGAILLGEGGTLRLSVRAPAGAPPPRVAVVRDAEDRLAQWLPVEKGEARSRPLAPGTYRVVLPTDGGASVTSAEAVIVAGEETRVELSVEGPASLADERTASER